MDGEKENKINGQTFRLYSSILLNNNNNNNNGLHTKQIQIDIRNQFGRLPISHLHISISADFSS
jgi:hypothetical protein